MILQELKELNISEVTGSDDSLELLYDLVTKHIHSEHVCRTGDVFVNTLCVFMPVFSVHSSYVSGLSIQYSWTFNSLNANLGERVTSLIS